MTEQAAAITAMSGPNIGQATSTTAAPLPESRTTVNAASGLLPVRSTLVAPMLPEPILRMSPWPASLVSTRPNGIEPIR